MVDNNFTENQSTKNLRRLNSKGIENFCVTPKREEASRSASPP